MSFLALATPAEGGGFNPLDFNQAGMLIWTLVIFLAALPFIWKIVMGPVTRALQERDLRAERAIAAAEKASREAEQARAQLTTTLAEAQASAAKLFAEARARAETRGAELEEEARAEAAQLLESARDAIRVEQAKAIAAIRNEVVELSLRAASRILERNVGSEDDRRFAAQVVAGEKALRG